MSIEGQKLDKGHYYLLKLIAHSSTSEVYLAEDTQLSRQVAIKIVLPEISAYSNVDATKWRSRLFVDEAEIIKKFNHPNILALFGCGEEAVNGNMLTYLVMPYCSEGSFAVWLKQRNSLLSPQVIAQFVYQAADALLYAHYNQIIHRNLKPSNFLIERNNGNTGLPNLLLTDFRIVRFDMASSSLGQSSFSTLIYMAPEQWNDHPVPATDQYALAAMTYELLTSHPPFQGTPEQLKQQHLSVQPQRPSILNPTLTKDIDEVILLALAKKPEDRFKSVLAFARACEQVMQVSKLPNNANVLNKQKGEDIHVTVNINQADAHMGIVCPLVLAGGRTVNVPISANAYNGQVITVAGQGKPSSTGGLMGDLIVTLVVTNATPTVPVNTNLPQKPASTFLSKARDMVKKDTIKANILLYCVLTGLIGCIAGIMLNANNILPPLLANIASGLGALIALIAGSWAILEKLLSKDVWRNAKKLPVVLFSFITVGILVLTALYLPSSADPYIHQGRLSLNDPMINNTKGYGWMEGTDSIGGGCLFKNGTYHAIVIRLKVNRLCVAEADNYSNFIYEAKMTISYGDCGGIIFDVNADYTEFYFFSICRDGQYYLKATAHVNGGTFRLLAGGRNPSVIYGLKQNNLIAVVAINGSIIIDVNHQSLATVFDKVYSSGHIGVVSEDNYIPTEAVFSNVRVWTL